MENKRIKKRTSSDVEIVLGIQSENQSMKMAMEKTLFEYCIRYFNAHYQALFITDDDTRDDVFQESIIVLWQNIEKKKIYVENGILKGKDGEKFEGSLTTYLMSIADYKYKEWERKKKKAHPPKNEEIPQTDTPTSIGVIKQDIQKWLLYGNDEQMKLAIILDYISQMTERCLEILSRFFYEEKKYETILLELPTYNSIDALKTQKYKCMQRLKFVSTELYNKLNT